MSPDGTDGFRKRVYAAVRHIPRGRVTTYGQIAAALGHPRAARAVGRALAVIPGPMARLVPWQRVVNAAGGIGFRDPDAMALQRDLLVRDGVTLRRGGTVDLSRFGWSPPGAGRGRKWAVAGTVDDAGEERFRESRMHLAPPGGAIKTPGRAGPKSHAARGAGRGGR